MSYRSHNRVASDKSVARASTLRHWATTVAIAGGLMAWLMAPGPESLAAEDGALPSLKDALASEVHGEARTKKNRIQVAYDFRDKDHVLDFAIESSGIVALAGLGAKREIERPKTEPGFVLMSRGQWVRSTLPLEEITEVTVMAQGVDGFSIRLRRGKAQVTVTFGDFPSISFDDGLGFGDVRRTLNLLPTKSYRFDLLLKNGKAIGKLDGRSVLEADVPKDFGTVNELFFGPSFMSGRGSGGGAAKVSQLQLVGVLSGDLQLLAGNRGRGESKQPPVWEKSYEHTGAHVTVVSPVSQEHASSWGERMSTLTTTLLRDYPATIAPGVPEEKDAPVDRKAPEFEYQRVIYLFDRANILEAYSGSGDPIVELPSGAFAVLTDPNQQEWDPGANLGWRITSQVLGKLYSSVPLWWQLGNCAYYSINYGHEQGLGASNAHASYAKLAREYLEKGTDPRLSTLLAGWTWSQGQSYPTALSWAWIQFLRHSEGGVHSELLAQFHGALRSGQTAEQAGASVFPTAQFNELYPKFEEYLKGL